MLRSPTVGLASNNRPAHIISRLRKRTVETSEFSLYQNNFCFALSQASTTHRVARTVYISSSFCCFTRNQHRIDKSASFKELHLYLRPFSCSTLSPQEHPRLSSSYTTLFLQDAIACSPNYPTKPIPHPFTFCSRAICVPTGYISKDTQTINATARRRFR